MPGADGSDGGPEVTGHTVLLVPVPELEPFVRARTEHYDLDYVSADPRFVHAHVTALAPFLAPDDLDADALDRVSEIASATMAFDFRLEEVSVFPNGIVHLLPEPRGPFEALTDRLWRAFPRCPPYAGEFGSVVPHLTLDALSDSVTRGSTRDLVSSHLPAHCRADRLDLAWYSPGDCRILHSWPLAR
ncbi:2'-5' RNA ligase family protein [Humibacillus xanthopallidus]|uniref:2'-5' RNA ligase superfamily protein n=1 Tax=Humibacillus xanthopallidus TaxID=412689 RepID=A0A543HJU2_9MICO|nr:2'-5' RNA ligase family protein [Humibacillus xanthopallidus]TQM58603.1 2'-5' RNA ligase superfamily protein [Humibacillus xanthopallidus]